MSLHSSFSSAKQICDLCSLKEQINSNAKKLCVFGDFRVNSCHELTDDLFEGMYAKIRHFFKEGITKEKVKKLYFLMNNMSYTADLNEGCYLLANIEKPEVILHINMTHEKKFNAVCSRLKSIIKPSVTMMRAKNRIDGNCIFYHIRLTEKSDEMAFIEKDQQADVSITHNDCMSKGKASSLHLSLEQSLEEVSQKTPVTPLVGINSKSLDSVGNKPDDLHINEMSFGSEPSATPIATPLVVSVDGVHKLVEAQPELASHKLDVYCPNLLNAAITGSMFTCHILNSIQELRSAILSDNIDEAYKHAVNIAIQLEAERNENGQRVTPFFENLYQEAKTLEHFFEKRSGIKFLGVLPDMDIEEIPSTSKSLKQGLIDFFNTFRFRR